MEETRKHSGIVLFGTAHLDGHIDSNEFDAIEFTLTIGHIHMDQCRSELDGSITQNEIVISSKWQAKAVLQIIKAMSAANGWKV